MISILKLRSCYEESAEHTLLENRNTNQKVSIHENQIIQHLLNFIFEYVYILKNNVYK